MLIIVVGLLWAAWVAVRKAGKRWWDYVAVATVAIALGKPLYWLAAGDLSRLLPSQIWSANADGKDQIIIASIAATLLLPVICAALIWLAARAIWQNTRA